jgi:F-type H+-transporting ATPase subunit delta
MAEKRTLARPYADAVFAIALERGALAQWSCALAALAAAASDARVLAVLDRPQLADEQACELMIDLAASVDAAAAETLTASEGRNFLRLLAERSRLGVLPEIAVLFEELKDHEENSVDVEVRAAAEIDAQVRAAMTAALEQRLQRKVRLHVSVDPSLIGGAVLRAGDLVIDGSLKSRLSMLATSLIR